mmetsp:Transcript_11902/g.38073  ORF Transcript_11902/g.38073 Transcript_11902/m.38073 type:complete len:275 (+) Transcript_11902:406-1230(+)
MPSPFRCLCAHARLPPPSLLAPRACALPCVPESVAAPIAPARCARVLRACLAASATSSQAPAAPPPWRSAARREKPVNHQHQMKPSDATAGRALQLLPLPQMPPPQLAQAPPLSPPHSPPSSVPWPAPPWRAEQPRLTLLPMCAVVAPSVAQQRAGTASSPSVPWQQAAAHAPRHSDPHAPASRSVLSANGELPLLHLRHAALRPPRERLQRPDSWQQPLLLGAPLRPHPPPPHTVPLPSQAAPPAHGPARLLLVPLHEPAPWHALTPALHPAP